jgi:5'-nucleotidase
MHTYQLKPWSECRALIVNDDGIDARGIKTLEDLARGLFAEVIIVAPAHEHSGMGHAISYKKNFKYKKIDDTHYTVEGTPADCAIVGINLVMKDNPPDIVLSGINHGDNAGNAILYSGTFGGALEAGLHGVPAIAFSQLRQPDNSTDFFISQKYFGQVMDFLQSVPWPNHVVMNVNFPPVDNHTHHTPHHVPSKTHHIVKGVEILLEEDGVHHIKSSLKSKYFESEDKHDLGHLSKGGVTITPVNTNWTCHETLRMWEEK